MKRKQPPSTDDYRDGSLVKELFSARNPSEALKKLTNKDQFGKVYTALDEWLGDHPDDTKLIEFRKLTKRPVADLREMASSEHDEERRVGLLSLHLTQGGDGESELQASLSDIYAPIRGDGVRFSPVGADRTRLYNKLIRLVREDPSSFVRSAAGERLGQSFADLYTLDFEGLPDLSKLLILDGLKGHNRQDEQRAESLLFSNSAEAAFKAARCLEKWGVLEKLRSSETEESRKIISKAELLGIAAAADSPTSKDVEQSLLEGPAASPGGQNALEDMAPETIVGLIDDAHEEERKRIIGLLTDTDRGFKKHMESKFPPPDVDRSAAALFKIAEKLHWKDWRSRASAALESGDPDVTVAAITALSVLDPEGSAELIEPYLGHAVSRVRCKTAKALVSLPSGDGSRLIAEFLVGELEEDVASVIDGVGEAGGAALARCIIDGSKNLEAPVLGLFLRKDIDPVGVELLVDAFPRAAELNSALRSAGPKAGKAFLGAWEEVGAQGRRKLLSWIKASGWHDEALKILKGSSAKEYEALAASVKALDAASREQLLAGLEDSVGGRSRRRLSSIIKG